MLDLVNLFKPMPHETNNEENRDSANNTREFTKRFLRRRPIKQKSSLNNIIWTFENCISSNNIVLNWKNKILKMQRAIISLVWKISKKICKMFV